jgi:nitrate reductase alpha subunit
MVGFSPIPAMSMVSYAAGARYLSLIGGNLPQRSTTGTATCRRPARRCGANRPMCRNPPIGTTRPTSLPGVPMCRRRARRTPTFLPKRATRAPKRSPSRPTIPKSPNSPIMWLHPKQGTDARFGVRVWACDFERVSCRKTGGIFSGLLSSVHRYAAAGALGKTR